MPIVSTVSKQQVEVQYNTMEKLMQQCETCNILKSKTAEEVVCYYICSDYNTEDGPAMVAIASFGNIHAMMTPDYVTEKQLVVFEFVLRNLEPHEEIVVFSKKDYDAVKYYKRQRKNKVRFGNW